MKMKVLKILFIGSVALSISALQGCFDGEGNCGNTDNLGHIEVGEITVSFPYDEKAMIFRDSLENKILLTLDEEMSQDEIAYLFVGEGECSRPLDNHHDREDYYFTTDLVQRTFSNDSVRIKISYTTYDVNYFYDDDFINSLGSPIDTLNGDFLEIEGKLFDVDINNMRLLIEEI